MTKRMLIDATQNEETRVAVVENDRLAVYDFDSIARKQIKGNIFLAKVTRVEPSLQACFVEYGGMRQGFLAFTEIHPDYYRIPVEDRQALLAEEAALSDDDDLDVEDTTPRRRRDAEEQPVIDEAAIGLDDSTQDLVRDMYDAPEQAAGSAEAIAAQDGLMHEKISFEEPADAIAFEENGDAETVDAPNLTEVERDNTIESVGGEEEAGQQTRNRRMGRLRRRYKIQEVIKRRQIMLVQATKEERGQKGAAMTTYISLPGRYCVLMPNSPRGGGISRKITDPQARRKMKELLAELEVPNGMSVILRTAGMTRTRNEIKRDLEYLLGLWDEIRRETMQSVAPAMIYEEADIFKRAVRDLYNRDMDEIIVSGEEGYKKIRTCMRQMVPSHAKRVQFYRDPKVPLFQRYAIERQIADIFNPRVELKSGGYIIINPTEALVSIDVNSGRATRERHIDDTALKTNMEAAEEVARQLRLRDLGGLVVIDFIDMESSRHNNKVERKLREAMAEDRARIEIGRISGFGLLELSRQRLHPSLTETHFECCAHCGGTGLTRTTESAAVVAMRAIEAEAVKMRAIHITANLPQQIVVYILNHKREDINRIEDYFGCRISLRVDENMNHNDFDINYEKGQPVPRQTIAELPIPYLEGAEDDMLIEDDLDDEPMLTQPGNNNRNRNNESRDGDDEKRGNREGRSRRGRRGGRSRGERRQNGEAQNTEGVEGGDVVTIPISEGTPESATNENGDTAPRDNGEQQPRREGRSRRGRRGGRNRYPNRRNRDGGERRPVEAADAPASEPAVMPKASPQPTSEKAAPAPAREPATASAGGEDKRGWWQKLID